MSSLFRWRQFRSQARTAVTEETGDRVTHCLGHCAQVIATLQREDQSTGKVLRQQFGWLAAAGAAAVGVFSGGGSGGGNVLDRIQIGDRHQQMCQVRETVHAHTQTTLRTERTGNS